MNMELTDFEIVSIAVDVLLTVILIGSLWYCAPKLKSYRRMVQVMTAESRDVPTDAALIIEWAEKRDRLDSGSEKWNAYTRALRNDGALCETCDKILGTCGH